MNEEKLQESLAKLDAMQGVVKMDRSHRYQGLNPEDGWVTLYGCTSVISQLAKDALEIWKLRQEREHVAKFCYKNQPDTDESQSVYTARITGAIGEFGYKLSSAGAASRGHRVHDAAEKWHTGVAIPGDLSEREDQMVCNYMEWFTQSGFEHLRSEFRLASFQHGYAGTADLLFKDNDGLILADIKTSKKSDKIYDEHRLQSAAYRGVLYELGFEPMRGLIIQVDRDGDGVNTHWLEDDCTKAHEAFCGLVKLSQWKDWGQE
jgi:hypothetical protein